jgi:hypothetical protein
VNVARWAVGVRQCWRESPMGVHRRKILSAVGASMALIGGLLAATALVGVVPAGAADDGGGPHGLTDTFRQRCPKQLRQPGRPAANECRERRHRRQLGVGQYRHFSRSRAGCRSGALVCRPAAGGRRTPPELTARLRAAPGTTCGRLRRNIRSPGLADAPNTGSSLRVSGRPRP